MNGTSPLAPVVPGDRPTHHLAPCHCGAALVLDAGRYEVAHAADCEAGS